MVDRRALLTAAAATVVTSLLPRAASATSAAGVPSPSAVTPDVAVSLRVVRYIDEHHVELFAGGASRLVQRGDLIDNWTVMEIVTGAEPFVVLEDFQRRDGHLVLVDTDGVGYDFAKSLEPTFAGPGALWLGHAREEIIASPRDLLADEILARPGDPDYAQIAGIFAPIRKVAGDTYSFIGTPDTLDKIGFTYGGRTANFEPALFHPSIGPICAQGKVWNGLVGGYLPVLRFVYPEDNGDWSEYLAFAPFRIVDGNLHYQPVWYRVSRIEQGRLAWSRHFDSFLPSASRANRRSASLLCRSGGAEGGLGSPAAVRDDHGAAGRTADEHGALQPGARDDDAPGGLAQIWRGRQELRRHRARRFPGHLHGGNRGDARVGTDRSRRRVHRQLLRRLRARRRFDPVPRSGDRPVRPHADRDGAVLQFRRRCGAAAQAPRPHRRRDALPAAAARHRARTASDGSGLRHAVGLERGRFLPGERTAALRAAVLRQQRRGGARLPRPGPRLGVHRPCRCRREPERVGRAIAARGAVTARRPGHVHEALDDRARWRGHPALDRRRRGARAHRGAARSVGSAVSRLPRLHGVAALGPADERAGRRRSATIVRITSTCCSACPRPTPTTPRKWPDSSPTATATA